MNLTYKNTPQFYELEFRKGLGDINPYLALVDTASKVFFNAARASSDEAKFLRSNASQFGHPYLYVDHLSGAEVFRFIYVSHISFILSQAEEVLALIKANPVINKKYFEDAKGDSLRKLLVAVTRSKEPDGSIKDTVSNVEAAEYIGKMELDILDYYRSIRNVSLHGVSAAKSDTKLEALYNALQREDIKRRFNIEPSPPSSLTHLDVILYSKAWQDAMKNLCRNFIHIKRDVLPVLLRQFGGKDARRRDIGLRNKLKQAYLLDDKEVDNLL